MKLLDYSDYLNYHNQIINVSTKPYGHTFIENFFPDDRAKKLNTEFKFPDDNLECSDVTFQRTKKALNDYQKLPNEIKNLINYLNSSQFIEILEKKFGIKGLVPDPNLFGGGMHESRRGGYLKIHSDFIYIRKKNIKRRLNLLIYLNEDWDLKWGGELELWDQKMQNSFLKVPPIINHAVIFRTDTESNHGFPDPLRCPLDKSRKSIAVYYYTVDNSLFKRTKYFYARWKRRPGIDEPKFGDNRSLFERIKNNFSFRFR